MGSSKTKHQNFLWGCGIGLWNLRDMSKEMDDNKANAIELSCHLDLKMKLRSFVNESYNLKSINFLNNKTCSLEVEAKMILLKVKKKKREINKLCMSLDT